MNPFEIAGIVVGSILALTVLGWVCVAIGVAVVWRMMTRWF